MLAVLLAAAAGLLVLPSHPPVSAPVARRTSHLLCAADAERLDVSVSRLEGGGLGIQVDPENRVATSSNPALGVGDVIISVDGVNLDGRHVTQLLPELPKKDAYSFGVERVTGVAGLEAVLVSLCAEHAKRRGDEVFSGAPMDPELATKVDQLAAQLEAAQRDAETTESALKKKASDANVSGGVSSPALSAKLLGFWELVAGEQKLTTIGLTGYGELEVCGIAAHFQCFQPVEKPPTMQTVEVIANSHHGSHMLASLKGDFTLETDGTSETPLLIEEYPRAEYGGEVQHGVRVGQQSRCTYVSDTLRLMRYEPTAAAEAAEAAVSAGEGAPESDRQGSAAEEGAVADEVVNEGGLNEGVGVRVYLKRTPEEAMGTIRRLLESAPKGGRHRKEGADVEPRWAAAERERMALADRERMAEGNRRGMGGPQVQTGGAGI